jgi:hypothetical protein
MSGSPGKMDVWKPSGSPGSLEALWKPQPSKESATLSFQNACPSIAPTTWRTGAEIGCGQLRLLPFTRRALARWGAGKPGSLAVILILERQPKVRHPRLFRGADQDIGALDVAMGLSSASGLIGRPLFSSQARKADECVADLRQREPRFYRIRQAASKCVVTALAGWNRGRFRVGIE